MLFWLAGFPFKLMIISAPMIYWWTGTAVIDSTVDDILVWLLPYVLSGMVFMSMLASNTVLPVMTDVTQLIAAPSIVRTVATAIVKPFGHPFKVTTKGVSSDSVIVQWTLLMPFALMAAGTALGMLVNLGPYSALHGTPGYTINVFWSLFNIAVLTIACSVCVELPKRRRDERFASNERAIVRFDGNPASFACTVADVSLGGARLLRDQGWSGAAESEVLHFRDGLTVPIVARRIIGGPALAAQFVANTSIRRALIRKLFTGGYDNEVEKVRLIHIVLGTARKVFG